MILKKKDEPPVEVGTVVHNCSYGIGDVIQGLMVVAGIKAERPTEHVTYAVQEWLDPWVRLFEGPDKIKVGPQPKGRLQTWKNDEPLNRNRWDLFATDAKVVPVLATPRPILPAAANWAEPYLGAILLVPWASYEARSWPLRSWRILEKTLAVAGQRCVIIDSHAADGTIREPGRSSGSFDGEKLIRVPPTMLAAIVSVASVTIANDSGMAHLAGALRRPAIAICGPTDGTKIFGCYPTVRVVNRMQDVTPKEVARMILGDKTPDAIPTVILRESEVHPHHPDEKADLFTAQDGGSIEQEPGELLQALVRCFKPGLILETGTYLGVSARLLGEACRRNGFGKVISLENDPARVVKAAQALADVPEVQVVEADSLAWIRDYQGPPFGFVLLDSDASIRPAELRLLKNRRLTTGPVFVHDTSRLRSLTSPDCPDYPDKLDALNLAGVECPLSRGWRLFDLR